MSRPVRRSQAISPFGIGSLVDFPGPDSLIHAGLDAWPFNENNPDHREFKVDDEKRLARRLNVEYFVQPPDFRKTQKGESSTQTNLKLTLPFLRFPLWHVCPRCGRMHLARYHNHTAPTCRGPVGAGRGQGEMHSQRKTIQVRFVAACQHGHLQDFPWTEWLFETTNPSWQPDGISKWLRLRSTGSASLTGVEIRAEEKDASGSITLVKKRTLAGAFEGNPANGTPSALSRIKILCEGHNPSLAIGKSSPVELTGCGQDLYPLLRGASNLYFSQVVSSIYIPYINDIELSTEILNLLDDYQLKNSLLLSAQDSENGLVSAKASRNALKKFSPHSNVDPELLAKAANKHILIDVLLDNRSVYAFLTQKIKISSEKKLSLEMVRGTLNTHFPDWEVDPEILMQGLSQKLEAKSDKNDITESEEELTQDESDFRYEEYRVFCRDIQDGYPKTNLLIRSAEIGEYGKDVSSFFDRISLLHKLRETRAFVGYSRIFPESEVSREDQRKLISIEKKEWLPAIIVRGEGIFLKFRDDKLNAWLAEHGETLEKRLTPINKNLSRLKSRRHQEEKPMSPKYVLIHTFAHLIINQLVYECGYGSASLRERIYADDTNNSMSGVLIYTAAGDSEGTMGGLVKMGQPGYLEGVIAKALEKSRWCSSDPVCSESLGQGPDNCNLGACHSCALLPETSCEEQNRLLDRGVVIGTLDQPNIGFFS